MAQSVEIYQPTPLMRMLGMLGIVGGVLLLGAFVAGTLFSDAVANNVRLFMFAAGGIAVALALYRRQAVVAPRLALLATAAVVGSGIWTLAQLVVAAGLEHPFAGTFGFVYFLAGLAAWLAAAAFGAAVLVIGAAARGLNPWLALAVRAGAMALAIGSPLAILGMDRLALTHQQPYGALIGNLALAGIALNGAGWVLLGLGVLLGGRRRQPV